MIVAREAYGCYTGPLLNDIYKEVKAEVDPRIKNSERIGIILDELTTINNDRVMDLFINTDLVLRL